MAGPTRPRGGGGRSRAIRLLVWAALLAVPSAGLARADGPAEAVDAAIAAARQEACTAGADRLGQILCAGRLRVGLREDYPPFAQRVGDGFAGFETDIARRVAERLGVALVPVPVTPANRIAALAEDRVDLVIATMGHTVARDGQARFIRPHYYASETVLVGPRDMAVRGWADLAGATVCTTLGNSSNAALVSHDLRLLLFDTPLHLMEQLERGVCPLAAQDDSFFAAYFARPAFAGRFAVKLGFDTLPWGMAVAKEGAARLAQVLSLLLQQWHRDGVLVSLAEADGVGAGFLREQQAVWRRPDCDRPAGLQSAGCLLPPLRDQLAPLAMADGVRSVEDWLGARLGLRVSLPMLTTAVGFQLFVRGLVATLVLVVGAMGCTAAVAVGFAAITERRRGVAAAAVRWLALGFRSAPVVLLLFVGLTAATAVARYSAGLALFVAIVVLGLFNGSYAAQSIADVAAELARERGRPPSFRLLASRAATPVSSFLINASKGSAVASMIGAPELVSATTDISSFSADRVTLYTVLLALYLLVVGGAILLCRVARRLLRRWEPAG